MCTLDTGSDIDSVESVQFPFPPSLRANLKLVRELGDQQAQGRTVGNLGNTHYLLGNYKKAIKYHEEVQTWFITFSFASNQNWRWRRPENAIIEPSHFLCVNLIMASTMKRAKKIFQAKPATQSTKIM